MPSPIFRLLLALASLILLASPALRAQLPCGQTQPDPSAPSLPSPCPRPYTTEGRWKDYEKRILGPTAILSSALVAAINQARNSPSAWEQGMEGYGRRVGSSMTQRAVAGSIQLGVEAALGEDSRYVLSGRDGFWPRMKDAATRSLLVPGRNGKRELAWGRLAGTFGGGFVSRAWEPSGHDGFRDGIESGGISFGLSITANVFREMTRGLSKHLPF